MCSRYTTYECRESLITVFQGTQHALHVIFRADAHVPLDSTRVRLGLQTAIADVLIAGRRIPYELFWEFHLVTACFDQLARSTLGRQCDLVICPYFGRFPLHLPPATVTSSESVAGGGG
jgi:hypothetical protein